MSGLGAALLLHPRSPWGRPVWRLGEQVSLSFDDGPDPEWTPRVLDRLEAAGVRASFFLLSAHAAAHPALVGRIAAAGHRVEVHGGAHRYAFRTTPARLAAEVRAAAALLEQLSQRAPRWYRPPFGGRPLWSDGRVAGLRLVTWSWSAGDWAGADLPGAPLRPTVAGDIVLLHDGPTPDPRARLRSLEALEVLLDRHPGALGPLPDP